MESEREVQILAKLKEQSLKESYMGWMHRVRVKTQIGVRIIGS